MDSQRFEKAIARFDELNSADPNIIEVEGKQVAKELHDARAMSRWIEALYPDASEAVKLAARCQHICRWEIPRSSFPEGRTAYLQWRNELKKFHASKSEEVLRSVGYDEQTIETVKRINLKKQLNSDPEVQAVEDALCMVFLETQFESYIDKWEEAKIISILQKTWGKMSGIAHEAALKLPFSNRAVQLIQKALDS